MVEVQVSNWCKNCYFLTTFVTSLTIIVGGILYYMDKKRISDPCYKIIINRKQDKIKQKEAEKFKYRLLVFPISRNITYIKNFVHREVND